MAAHLKAPPTEAQRQRPVTGHHKHHKMRRRAADRFAAAIPRRCRWPIALALLLVSLVYAFGSLRARVRQWNDFAFIFAAGRTWLEGHSPYDFERWNAQWVAIRPPETVVSQPMPYMYPPHWGPIAVFFAGFPWPLASRLWDGVSTLSYAATIAFCVRLLEGRWLDAYTKPALWAFVALATLNPAMRYSIAQSQMTMFAMFGLAGAFWAWHEKRVGWLVLFSFIAALKPQFSLLGLAYLFLNGGHVGVTLAAAAAALVGLVSMMPSHLADLPSQYARCYALHMQLDFNDPKNFSGLPALFFSRDAQHAFMPVSSLLALAAAVALTVARRADAKHGGPALGNPLWQLAIVVAITGAFMPLHSYDLVLYTPVVLAAYERRSGWLGPLLVGLVLFAGRPAFVSAHLHISRPSSYLTAAILLTLVVAVGMAWNRRGVHDAAAVDSAI